MTDKQSQEIRSSKRAKFTQSKPKKKSTSTTWLLAGGAVLVVGQLGLFSQNVTAGRGWVAIALVIFGRWRPLRVMAGALLFGLTDALQLRIQSAGGGIESDVPYELFQALPYIVTILVVVIATARAKDDAMPEALGVPYVKGAHAG